MHCITLIRVDRISWKWNNQAQIPSSKQSQEVDDRMFKWGLPFLIRYEDLNFPRFADS